MSRKEIEEAMRLLAERCPDPRLAAKTAPRIYRPWWEILAQVADEIEARRDG